MSAAARTTTLGGKSGPAWAWRPVHFRVATPAPHRCRFKAIFAETRHAQRFPSTGAVKTDKNEVWGIAEINAHWSLPAGARKVSRGATYPASTV